MEIFENLKKELISKPYISAFDLKDLEKFSKLLNRVIIDYNYKLDYIDYFLLASKYRYLQDWTTALIYTDIVIELKPDFARVYNLKAVILLNIKRYQQALENIDKAIELNPNLSFLWDNKSLILLELGFYKEALDCVNKAIELDPNNFFAYNNKASILFRLGKYKEALENIEKSLSIRPDFNFAIRNKGLCLMYLNRIDEGIEIFKELITKEPNNPEHYYNLACAYAQKGEKNQAIDYLKRAIEMDQNFKFIALDDKDFDSIRDSEEFKELVK